MRRESAVHFRKTEGGDILVDENGGRLLMAAGASDSSHGITWRGAWDSGEEYVEYDVVRNRSGLYICTDAEAEGEPGAPGEGQSLGTSWTSAQTNPDPEARWITAGTTDLVVEDGGPSFTWATGDTRPVAIGVIETATSPFAFDGKVTATFPGALTITRYAQAKPFATTGLNSVGAMTSGQEYDLDDASGYDRIVFIASGVSAPGRGTVTLEIEQLSGEAPINVPPASTSWDLMVQGV